MSSFKLLTGKNILTSDIAADNIARKIFFAPFALVSHGTEAEPVFNYANESALNLFEMSWENFIKLPSRFSAEAESQDDRAHFLKKVSDNGFVDDYAGVRISSRGRRFQITDATVWNVIEGDHYYGQAAMIREWNFL